jgi:hypothetical protein
LKRDKREGTVLGALASLAGHESIFSVLAFESEPLPMPKFTFDLMKTQG